MVIVTNRTTAEHHRVVQSNKNIELQLPSIQISQLGVNFLVISHWQIKCPNFKEQSTLHDHSTNLEKPELKYRVWSREWMLLLRNC